MYQRIIVPLDGSALAEQALPQAESLARMTGAELVLVRVVDLSRLDHFGVPALSLEAHLLARLEAHEREVAQAYLEELSHQLAERRVHATTEIRRGLVGRELIAFASPHDLIVMATKGRGSAAQSLLSSTTETLARHARSPVLLVQTAQSLVGTALLHSYTSTACKT